MNNTMGLSTEGHEEPREFTLPQNRPNRTSTYDMLMQSAPTVGNGDPAAEVPSRHRPQGSQDTKEIAAKDQEGTGRSPEETQDVAVKERVRQNGSVRPSERSRICGKCGGHLTGQFVRALGDTYHLECFTCHDCGKIVASKFFPVPDSPPGQYPLCETDYFRRLDLLCHACGGALRGSYITALERKYHIEHFTCSVCPTVFGAQDSYYEHEGDVYCHYHYSTKFAQRCNGCQTAILKQFVEIFRNGQNQHWHPECYMIHKYWNVRLHQGGTPTAEEKALSEGNATEEMRKIVREGEEHVEGKVLWIWRTLSSFEEKSATCISDMLLHVSNGAYMDGVMAAKKFIMHVDLLFSAADGLDRTLYARTTKGLSYSREAKLLCKKVVAFFQLLAESQETGVRRLGVTQELLSLVTGLAHYLKLLIRICLQGALKLEREVGSQEGLTHFLEDIGTLDDKIEIATSRDSKPDNEGYVARTADNCGVCGKSVEDKCFALKDRRFHSACLVCAKCGRPVGAENLAETRWDEASQKIICDRHATPAAQGDFVPVSRLQQYVHLLRVAHARLLATLRTSGALPHTSDDPNLTDYDSNQGHRVSPKGSADPPLLRSNTRSKSYAGSTRREQSPSYEQTLGDIRRLRSTRMDKQVSTTNRRARKSRIIDGPEGMRPGSEEKKERRMTGNFQIIEERDANGEPMSQLNFGHNEGMTLDDIPRLVQAQQTREQRPNASKYARGQMVPQEPKARLVSNGHNRQISEDQENLHKSDGVIRTKKYFSELSALEYFIVRHVAVLSMEPLLEGLFNQEELLDLIETKRPTFWGKFGKAFQKNEGGKKGKAPKRGIFGVPLEQLVERDYAESTDGVGPGALRIPVLIQDSISAMRTMDMSVEGVFRKNGNIKRLNDVREEIDSKEAVDVDLTKENPVQVAALLKKFLRDLPDPLLTFKLHKLWITSQNIADEEKRRRVLHLTCCLLPKAHRDSMEVLFAFLQWVSSFSHVDEDTGSKMDTHNLATVMAPNILHLGKRDVPLDDNLLAIETVHSLIEFNEYMCEVPEDLSMILNDSSLFSASADITTKEILKRYGDRAVQIKPSPNISNAAPPGLNPSFTETLTSPGMAASPPPRSRDGRSSAPVVTRVDTDPEQASAWQNESSVRHVDGDMVPPSQPYAMGQKANLSAESTGQAQQQGQSSPSRSSYHRNSGYDKPRPMGVT